MFRRISVESSAAAKTSRMLRIKETQLVDNQLECFDLSFYRVSFVFVSRHLILVLPSGLKQTPEGKGKLDVTDFV